jgi:hypothetical protein
MSYVNPTLTNNKVKAKKQKGKRDDGQQYNVRTTTLARYCLDVIVKVNSDRDVIIYDASVGRVHNGIVQYNTANTASNKQSPRDGLHMNLLGRPRQSRAGGTDTRNWLETLGIEPPHSKIVENRTQQFAAPIRWQYLGEQVCQIGCRIFLMHL